MALTGTPLPYGLRDVKLTPFIDAAGTILAAPTASVDLPNGRTLSFSETEEFEELRGDDRVVATRGSGAMVEWELEAGGLSFEAVKVIAGGLITESGVTPNQKKTYTKKGRDTRPYFQIEGQAISDSGGDLHCVIRRSKLNDALEGEFADGTFFLTAGSGIGLPMPGDDTLYLFVENETAVAIPIA